MNPPTPTLLAPRILVVDDNPTIHEDIRKVLCPASPAADYLAAEAALFGEGAAPNAGPAQPVFEIDSALQGQEGLARVEAAILEQRPYALAFVDVRMPPGWDGIETIEHLWKCAPDLQVVVCTAYSDHSWDDIRARLGQTDNLVILKKPFDNIEVLQLAHALTKKWLVTRELRERLDNLEAAVGPRTRELVKANQQLQTEVWQRAKTDIALRASEERFQQSFTSTTVAMAILDCLDQRITDANDSFLKLVGRQREEVLHLPIGELQLANDSQSQAELHQVLSTRTPLHNRELHLRRPSGAVRNVLLSAAPLQLGADAHLLLAVVDVTEQRGLEVQLRQSQKMEAIGQLAAGVAHDFNNLLTVIIGHSSIQIGREQLDPGARKALEQIKLAGERASGLTRQLLAFSRKQVMQRTPLDLNRTVRQMKKMLARLVGEAVRMEYDCVDSLSAVLADESNFEQILLNLVVNARDALPGGGTVRVSLRDVEVTAPSIAQPEARPGRFVQLRVQDNGVGMSEEVLRKVFEPFFTTKPVGQGTGLGLSTVYGIVKQHEGWVEVHSKLGAGTTFEIYLPITHQKPDVPALSGNLPPPAARGATVLVVEDEPPVRDFVCEVLRQAGYQVIDAECGPSALTLWEAFGKNVDLVLTDLVMPNGLTGTMLAQQLRGLKPGLKVIYMSGYSPDLNRDAESLVDDLNFLPKPFGQSRLLTLVRKALEPAVDTDRASAFPPAASPAPGLAVVN